ncbi:MAG: hypothetical protein ACR2QF_04680 [Geminicoccaceae bacterium]
MLERSRDLGRINHLTRAAVWISAVLFLAILLATSACTLSDIPIESAGPPSGDQDNGGGGY